MLKSPQFPTTKKGRVLQRALLLVVNPLILVVLYSYLYVYLHLPDQLQVPIYLSKFKLISLRCYSVTSWNCGAIRK